jgi:hypothetical protein
MLSIIYTFIVLHGGEEDVDPIGGVQVINFQSHMAHNKMHLRFLPLIYLIMSERICGHDLKIFIFSVYERMVHFRVSQLLSD